MGYVRTEYAKAGGTVINVQIRKRQVEAEIIKGRFFKLKNNVREITKEAQS